MKNQVLLINDLAGYGKVALSAMFPVLAQAGLDIFNLPTALVSNTLDYGKFEILETTEYMKKTLAVWKELRFSFDAICTGFITSEEQTKLIHEYSQAQKAKGTWIFVDPIMGDDGKLYNGISQQHVSYMRELCAVADVIVPNFTEAALLAEMYQERTNISREEGRKLIEKLRMLGSESVIVTSARVDGKDMVIGYDGKKEIYFEIPFEYVPVRFPGTGDIFSAILISRVLTGAQLKDAVKIAMNVVRKLILLNQKNSDKYKGILIEKNLEVLNFEET
ncbi:pyridoxamine kinase [Clostridium sp. OS1-26]|uniref:pyridoxamine kinase n=1 Tax=Clostridium sp. OS1-26 TaxID=3070681 RepID=UPI0027DF4485|nr:pyridoxamine kinase [Clostridium sp. OS1-26]WML32699.1 pyridoxamine kinase [Clostridium sp. OS1-26]